MRGRDFGGIPKCRIRRKKRRLARRRTLGYNPFRGGKTAEATAALASLGYSQAEIGAACAMGAAMIAYLMGLDMDQIEYAAEMGIEHHLGLTCDPVGGYVMIPCIERNAVCALRAIDAAILARHLRRVHRNRVSFDMVVETMNKTGIKLPIELKESALGGLASVVKLD